MPILRHRNSCHEWTSNGLQRRTRHCDCKVSHKSHAHAVRFSRNGENSRYCTLSLDHCPCSLWGLTQAGMARAASEREESGLAGLASEMEESGKAGSSRVASEREESGKAGSVRVGSGSAGLQRVPPGQGQPSQQSTPAGVG
mmetsp:Transcript_10981/g.32530  ORF Transcript_10981/g.32530 Transcript_10981/m.32530 type:complete len:142 (+) Transcript_10981:668-1093(+)